MAGNRYIASAKDQLSVAELCEPYDRDYAAWETFVRTEREYDERHKQQDNYELVVIWADGGKDVYNYETLGAAKKSEKNMRMVFGNQIEWTGINERRF